MILTAGISKSATRRTRESSDRRERLMRTGDLTCNVSVTSLIDLTTTDIQITVSGSPTNLTVGDTFTSFCDPRAARTKAQDSRYPDVGKQPRGARASRRRSCLTRSIWVERLSNAFLAPARSASFADIS